MFDIGFWELVLISIVALVVLGPERLPHAIRTVMKFIGAAKGMANNVKDELTKELKIQELQENLRKAEQMEMKNLSPELQKTVDDLKHSANEVQQSIAKETSAIQSAHQSVSQNAQRKPVEHSAKAEDKSDNQA
ncbi:Sec-independent protein translocase protein TatB [Vibrio palustris]|uniref:Sec-independent protein translocase protein TatB n=1 Tax=Vibrio palustris TaxID=1918946 RepID=A0A1R4B882_9VIBR|nr:Sec-independent protein translocase protein TatB [Vibrio palustris]